MEGLFRLGVGGLYEEERKHTHPRTFALESTTGPSRLRIGVEGIGALRVLTTAMPEPFWILYALLVARGEEVAGRYQSESPVGREDLEAFLDRFGGLFETDGRHEVWVKSVEGPDLLVYDPHEVLFAYGNLDRFRAVLAIEGYAPGEVEIPSPHMHYYHDENDADVEALLSARRWTYSPLGGDDEDRAEG